jgi:hypothetical protein
MIRQIVTSTWKFSIDSIETIKFEEIVLQDK